VEAILNGIDTTTWNPAADPHLAAGYDRSNLTGKNANKEALQKRTGLRVDPESPVVGMVTRLTDQKGISLVLDGAGRLLDLGAQLVVLGSGEKRFEIAMRELAQSRPHQVSYSDGFDDPLAHLIQGGSDLFLMPSRYEPCGLTQMISLAYGTVPVVRAVGGLADTVEPADAAGTSGTGFLFEDYSAEAMLETLTRALSVFRNRESWARVMRRAMGTDFSWERAAAAYEELYRRAVST
jgi:starch synthase